MNRTARTILVYLAVIFLVVMGFLVYALLGHLLPGTRKAKAMDIGDLISQLGLDTTMMQGRPLVIGVTVVLPFIFFGQLLLRAGGSDFFADLAAALMGLGIADITHDPAVLQASLATAEANEVATRSQLNDTIASLAETQTQLARA